MSLKLYYDLMSQPSRAVLIFLRMNKIPFTDQAVALRRGQHLEDDYAKVNPFKQVPAIDDNGFTLTESSAILKYLADSYLGENSHHWYPKDAKKRAKADEYLDWHHLNTRMNCSVYFQHRSIRPALKKAPVDLKKLENYKSGVLKVAAAIDSYFLQDRKFMLGSEVSIADLQAVCELEQVLTVGLDPFRDHQRLADWAKRVRDITQPHYEGATTTVYGVAQRLLQKLKDDKLDSGLGA
ncbi:putative Glutathione S-transferase theta-1 [Hypsibius exemplaris]|uniref:Glutathione S-transferase theta-1 n=1 Tax=Hypsibius exemplaris TaxID=2072580 RepID=A0A1W0XD33_HYPEX|nr:putative Glutathione S-transferase theta-1 [Hypsibius exemplaris]